MFKVGDKVKCIDAHPRLTLNGVYTVSTIADNGEMVGVLEFEGGRNAEWFSDRFELVKDLPDMSENVKPYGLCTPEEQEAFDKAKHLLRFDGDDWVPLNKNSGGLWGHISYRTYTPLEDIYIPWEAVNDKWQWAAKDDDGEVWLYDEKPECICSGEFRTYNDMCSTVALKGVKPGNKPWNQSLIQRPKA